MTQHNAKEAEGRFEEEAEQEEAPLRQGWVLAAARTRTTPSVPNCCSDEKYYSSELVKCKDGSKSFSRDRLNDNFCDCPNGTDEPVMLISTTRLLPFNKTLHPIHSSSPLSQQRPSAVKYLKQVR